MTYRHHHNNNNNGLVDDEGDTPMPMMMMMNTDLNTAGSREYASLGRGKFEVPIRERTSIRVVAGEAPSRRPQQPLESPSRRGGLPANEQGSRAAIGQVKVGEMLSKNYDLSAVNPEDRSSVLATIQCIVSLEDRMPELDITISQEPGYYAIVVRGFDEFIDVVNWHNKVRMTQGYGTHNKMRLVHNFLANPDSGILVVRVGMRETGSATETGLPSLPSVPEVPITATTMAGQKKRGRTEDEEAGGVAPVDFALAKTVLDSLRDRCNMDEVDPVDVHRLLSVLYHVTVLDANLPALQVSPVRRDETGGAYVMTCRGFINMVDFDQLYEKLVRRAQSDDALRTVLSVAYNVTQGVLEVCVQGGRPAGPGKRRRAAPGDGQDLR
jgi:hypothetical protein